jgi:dihydrofolate reductase
LNDVVATTMMRVPEVAMAKLVYSTIASLDGYVADTHGSFDWSAPDEQVHAFVNDLERPIGTYLYGRRMYDVMLAWETMDVTGEPAVMRDYAQIWRAAEKVVYSTTADTVMSAKTRLEHNFDPDAVRELKTTAHRDISIGGPCLAGQALKAGLVDELHLFLCPVVVGGGTAALPADVQLRLELVDLRRFDGGLTHLHYAVTR